MFGLNESALTGLLIVILVFLAVRELLCWYWKINQAVGLLREIRDLLQDRQVPAVGPETPSGQAAAPGPSRPCEGCDFMTPIWELETHAGREYCVECLEKKRAVRK